MKIDDTDRKILVQLQRDASQSLDEIAKAVGSSKTPVWNRIRKLRDAGQVDHYMLFANRRLAGNADQLITTHIAKESGLPDASIYRCGIEQLELWL